LRESLDENADLESIEFLKKARQSLTQEIGQVIIGQQEVIEQLLMALFSKGHCLLIGVPGLAKTLLISTLASILDLKFNRIQFTPDLMPSDIIGTDIIQEDRTTSERNFRFLPGPVFANVVLADEINRTPPKTQAALLQAMQEYKVSVGGKTYNLDLPFFVLATQNPIEFEGTYPLPEAQLDRFMFNIQVDYPKQEEEIEIVLSTTSARSPVLNPVMSGADVLKIQEIIRKVPAAEHVVKYAVELVRSTRPNEGSCPDSIKKLISWGAGPRASQYLVLGAKSRAVIHGRYHISCEDIRAVAKPVLRHRVLTSFTAEADGISSLNIIDELLNIIKVPEPS